MGSTLETVVFYFLAAFIIAMLGRGEIPVELRPAAIRFLPLSF